MAPCVCCCGRGKGIRGTVVCDTEMGPHPNRRNLGPEEVGVAGQAAWRGPGEMATWIGRMGSDGRADN